MFTILSAAIGGLMRLAPELIKFFDKKNERAHEALMTDKEIEIAKYKLQETMLTTDASMHNTDMTALTAALTEQGQTARIAGKFVAAVSALVRPIVTYWLVVLYSTVKLVSIYLAVTSNAGWAEIKAIVWTDDDMNLLTAILSFWFVGRVWESKLNK